MQGTINLIPFIQQYPPMTRLARTLYLLTAIFCVPVGALLGAQGANYRSGSDLSKTLGTAGAVLFLGGTFSLVLAMSDNKKQDK
jgi:hypothetical protein